MDYSEFEIPKTDLNTEATYSDEVEYLIKELNAMAHAAGRYSRSVQLPAAIRISETLNTMRESQNASTSDEALPIGGVVKRKCDEIRRKTHGRTWI